MKKLLLSALVLSAGVASAQWTEQATGFNAVSRGISQIDIVDANVVWAVAYDGTDTENNIQEFTMTVNGGDLWTPGTIDMGDPALAVNNLEGIDGNTAWVSAIDGSVAGGTLFKTSDGGMIWESSNPIDPNQATPSFTYLSSFQNVVHFFDANNGLVQGDPVNQGPVYDYEIYTTTDGGASWTRVPAANLPNAASSAEYGYNGGNTGAGNMFWFVTNNGKLYRTTAATMNAVNGWERLNTPIADFGGTTSNGRVVFTDMGGTTFATAKGVLVATSNGGTSYSRYTTTDGGSTWSAATPYTTTEYRTMTFIPHTDVLVANGGAPTYGSAYSTDMGASWTAIDTGVQRTAIEFLNGTTGWAGGFNEDATTGGIFKYTGANLGISTVAERSQFTATPNPTNGMLNVANENANITDVVVYDLLGKQVYAAKFNALSEVNLDLTPLTAGAYILTATADNGAKQTIKIMKN